MLRKLPFNQKVPKEKAPSLLSLSLIYTHIEEKEIKKQIGNSLVFTIMYTLLPQRRRKKTTTLSLHEPVG